MSICRRPCAGDHSPMVICQYPFSNAYVPYIFPTMTICLWTCAITGLPMTIDHLHMPTCRCHVLMPICDSSCANAHLLVPTLLLSICHSPYASPRLPMPMRHCPFANDNFPMITCHRSFTTTHSPIPIYHSSYADVNFFHCPWCRWSCADDHLRVPVLRLCPCARSQVCRFPYVWSI